MPLRRCYDFVVGGVNYLYMIKAEKQDDIYKMMFPYDPIQEWANEKMLELDKKYEWVEKYFKTTNRKRLRTNAPKPETVILKW